MATWQGHEEVAEVQDPAPWGAVRLRFPEDVVRNEPEHHVLFVLKPTDWNREVHLGWRFDSAQLDRESAK